MKQIELKKKAEGSVDLYSYKPVIRILNKHIYHNIMDNEINWTKCEFIEYSKLGKDPTPVDINTLNDLIKSDKVLMSIADDYNNTGLNICVHPVFCADHYKLESDLIKLIIYKAEDVAYIECYNDDSSFEIVISADEDYDNIDEVIDGIDYEFLLTSDGKVIENDDIYQLFKEIMNACDITITNA